MAGRRRRRKGRWRRNRDRERGYGRGYEENGYGAGGYSDDEYGERRYGRRRGRGYRDGRWDRWNGRGDRDEYRGNRRRGWDERDLVPSSAEAEDPYIALHNVEKAEPIASLRGVSDVARSHSGFLAAYKLHSGNAYAMGRDGFTGRLWSERRRNFIRRNEEAAKLRGEPWWRNGEPTRRHLALIMWAYTPTPQRTALWLKTLRTG